MRKTVLAFCAAALLAGCNQQAADNQTAGNTVMPSAETRTDDLGGGTEAPQVVAVDAETAKQLMEQRHENYEKIGDAMKAITRELKGDSPDLAIVRKGADTIVTLAPQVKTWFPAGTGPDVGKTEAKAEIWQRPDDFRAKAQGFEQAATAFQAAARSEDVAAIRGAHAELGKSCKACHDLYRVKE